MSNKIRQNYIHFIITDVYGTEGNVIFGCLSYYKYKIKNLNMLKISLLNGKIKSKWMTKLFGGELIFFLHFKLISCIINYSVEK